ncbi:MULTISPECIES: TIGR04219 family outer membrane beta-barrel protein [Microbulbifer]|uniref:TIGR04219 family outer membrane beta-barrel protein n=1 Tax=Microbulbifer TaxID=48073 RepID=UPI001E29374C|nr:MULTISPECIES: TIGR04219 family outer membrane beta-barrel protein [Microbulbifer]UHQ55001.1 TIGR04219 family outer membrane beta-barrel protein [Microbulbifer sp. YPW16]
MKKTSLAICMALASGAASADTILGFDATAGVWMPSYSGDVGQDNFDIEEFSPAEDNVTFLQAALEHPIPLVPNIMLSHSGIETDGVTRLSDFVEFGDETFIAGTEVSSNLDLTHTDATLYYEILDNWVNLDIGFTARQYSGELQLDSAFQSENIELSGVLPMAYGMARFDLPFSGWSVIAQGNATGYNGDSHTDITAKVRWDFAPALDFAVEGGYRSMTLDLQELDELESNLDISGPYIGLNLHL